MSKFRRIPERRSGWRHRRSTFGRAQHQGTAATEFALVLPILLLLAVGCLDVGRAIRIYTVMSNAASAGAEYGATHGFYAPYTRTSWEREMREAVRDELVFLVGPRAVDQQFAVSITTDQDAFDPALARVTVDIRHDFATVFHWSGFPATLHLQCRSSARRYR